MQGTRFEHEFNGKNNSFFMFQLNKFLLLII
jgi:hypothetical protein